jgi:hypothetical protein
MPLTSFRGQPLYGEWMATSVKDAAWMEWVAKLMGGASRQSTTAMLPPQRFHCLLDELPLHLVPAGARRTPKREGSSSALMLNPLSSVLAPGKLPEELQEQDRRDLLERFYLQSTVAWVKDAGSGTLNPFWLGPRSEAALARIRAGEIAPWALPAELRRVLERAEIMVPADHAIQRGEEWNRVVARSRDAFRQSNYAPLRNLIHPFHVAALRRYYRHAIRKGEIRLGDNQSARRYVAHNEPVARYFHRQLAKVVSAVVGEAVKPSYVYLASYLSGAELKKHTDRAQCEFSVTLCLDFSPEPELATPWPIRLDTPQGEVALYQALGDGLVYRGTRVPHYRRALGEGFTSTSIFFHYVAADFSGPLD